MSYTMILLLCAIIITIVVFVIVIVAMVLLGKAITTLEEEMTLFDGELNKLEETLLEKGIVNLNDVVTIKE